MDLARIRIIVVRDFLARVDIPQCSDLEVVVVDGVGFGAVINVTKFTVHLKTLLTVEPQDMFAVRGGVFSPEGTDYFAGGYQGSCEQPLAMDVAVTDKNSRIRRVASPCFNRRRLYNIAEPGCHNRAQPMGDAVLGAFSRQSMRPQTLCLLELPVAEQTG